jgi:hypothetical protein
MPLPRGAAKRGAEEKVGQIEQLVHPDEGSKQQEPDGLRDDCDATWEPGKHQRVLAVRFDRGLTTA